MRAVTLCVCASLVVSVVTHQDGVLEDSKASMDERIDALEDLTRYQTRIIDELSKENDDQAKRLSQHEAEIKKNKETDNALGDKLSSLEKQEERFDTLEQRFKEQEIKLKMATHVESGSFMSPFYANDPVNPVIDHYVVFERLYSGAPLVLLSLDLLDADEDMNLRYNLRAEHVTASSFLIKMTLWSDTHIYSARVTWVAIPKPEHLN